MHTAFIVADTLFMSEEICKSFVKQKLTIKSESFSWEISMVSHRVPISMIIQQDNLNITPEKMYFALLAVIRTCLENTVILLLLAYDVTLNVH